MIIKIYNFSYFVMGRRKEYKREELKERAILAAEALVRDKGFSALTARKVSTKIGYAVGTLYNMFENLDDLILHVNGQTLDDMYEYMCGAASMRQLSKFYIEYANKNSNLWAMLFEHSLKEREILPDWYQEKIDRMFVLAEKVLAKNLDVSRKEIKKSAKVLWASIHGICALSLTGTLETTKSETADILADAVVDNYLKGIRS